MYQTLALWLSIISLPCLLIGVYLTKSHIKDVEFEHIQHPEKSFLENATDTSPIKLPLALIFLIVGVCSFVYLTLYYF